MKEFPMCPDCAEEYHDPKTRRYDAQPVSCNECGPEVYLIGRDERGRELPMSERRFLRVAFLQSRESEVFISAVMLPMRRQSVGFAC